MRVGFKVLNITDRDGNPTGGNVVGTGFTISWQNGPLGRGENRVEPNGAFVEDVIDAARQRIQFFQDGKFACDENRAALSYLNLALEALDSRTARREAANIEGTHAEEPKS